MAKLTSLECANQLLAALRARWIAHTDFTTRGTVIEAPRLMHYPDGHTSSELVSLMVPGIQAGERILESPATDRHIAPLHVSVLVDVDYPKTDPTGDPAAAVLAALNPIAIVVQKRIEIDLRELRSPATPTALSDQFFDWAFVDYETSADIDGNRLRAAGVFTYHVGFAVPQFFDTGSLDDLQGIDVDYNLYGGVGNTVFPDPPHAEDDETLP